MIQTHADVKLPQLRHYAPTLTKEAPPAARPATEDLIELISAVAMMVSLVSGSLLISALAAKAVLSLFA